MLYKIASPNLVFLEDSILASGMVVRSDDAGVTWQNVQAFETSIVKTTDPEIIAGAMAIVALQLAHYDAEIVQVRLDVAALLDSPAYTVEL